MKKRCWLLLLVSPYCHAFSLFHCTGTDSAKSAYTVTATLNDENQFDGGIFVRVLDINGYQYDNALLPKTANITLGQSVLVNGPFDGGQMAMSLAFQTPTNTYTGTMNSWGNSGQIIDIAISCTITTKTAVF